MPFGFSEMPFGSPDMGSHLARKCMNSNGLGFSDGFSEMPFGFAGMPAGCPEMGPHMASKCMNSNGFGFPDGFSEMPFGFSGMPFGFPTDVETINKPLVLLSFTQYGITVARRT